jgi:hypothetical protein
MAFPFSSYLSSLNDLLRIANLRAPEIALGEGLFGAVVIALASQVAVCIHE